MPQIEVLFYRDEDGTAPLNDWLTSLQAKARAKCLAHLQLLEKHGHELRRPHAENLGNGLYELRVKFFRVNYRMLYFFYGRDAACLARVRQGRRGSAKGDQTGPSAKTAVRAEPGTPHIQCRGMTVSRPKSKTLGYLYDRFIRDDPEQVAFYEEALSNAEVAGAIYELRKEARLSQRALAERVGTTASVICRLEDADYEGHSLSMLKRVAAAVGRRVEISFPPVTEATTAKMTSKGPSTAKPPNIVRVAAVASKDSVGVKHTLADPEKTVKRLDAAKRSAAKKAPKR
jgi:phage-related protein/transcriptional regulator with XRE-family HTH domain